MSRIRNLRLELSDAGGLANARIRAADGSWHLMETAGTNLFGDPAVGGFVLSMRDVTTAPDRNDALIGAARERITPAQPVARRAA